MPVCVLGMHRSGTSMVTRMLNLCGMNLGRNEDLLTPESGILNVNKEDNPEGYWENLKFIFLNDEILSLMDGTAYNPPALSSGWSDDKRLDDLKVLAKELIAQFEQSAFWGWKDPRNTLTIEFWQSLIPDLKIILCIRNPLEVSESLTQRQQGETIKFSLELWRTYYEQYLDTIGASPYLVTDYSTYSYNPHGELSRLLDFLEIDIEKTELERAAAAFVPGLHRKTLPAFLLANLKDEPKIGEYYAHFTQQAGLIYQEMVADSQSQLELSKNSVSYLFNKLSAVELQLEAAQALQETYRQSQDSQEQSRRQLEQEENLIRHQEEISLLMFEYNTELEQEKSRRLIQEEESRTLIKSLILEYQAALEQEQRRRYSQEYDSQHQIESLTLEHQAALQQLKNQLLLIAQELGADSSAQDDILQQLHTPSVALTSKVIYRGIVPLSFRLFLKYLRPKS